MTSSPHHSHPPPPAPTSAYGCLERREDAEAVLGERLPAAAEERYFDHIRTCAPCWRAHRLLQGLYAGPEVASERSSTALRYEFAAILEGVAAARVQPTWRDTVGRLGAAAAVLGLALTAGLLALFLVAPDQKDSLWRSTPQLIAFDEPDTVYGGLDHPARVYGRIIGGHGRVVDGDGEPLADHIFPAGTALETGPGESMQLQVVGTILTNIGPNSALRWRSASPAKVEFGLDRGLVAFRYDRLPGDPELTVTTPTATVEIRGTVFTVEVDDAGETAVSVLRGEVAVRDARAARILSEVRAGYRFDVTRRSFADVARAEVQVALPLSLGAARGAHEPPGPQIPSDWTVPGLPARSDQRTLDNLVEITREVRPRRPLVAGARSAKTTSLAPNDDGEVLLGMLVDDAQNSEAEAIRGALARCKDLYHSPASRYRATPCLRSFIDRHGGDRRAAEAHLLIGIQRMDYARDHRAAMAEFRRFIAGAPDHPEVELARYRLWLAATEIGAIQEARSLGGEYLHRYPRGRYVGQVVKRFPDLAGELDRSPKARRRGR